MQPLQHSGHLTGGRRKGRDRRFYTYACCIPERRSGKDRRRSGWIYSMMVPADKDPGARPERSG